MLDQAYLVANRQDRGLLKSRFDQLAEEGRIRFVTFHQSFSYEDFVEGLRAESDETSGQLRYEVVDGVFKSLCEVAAAKVMQKAEAPLDLGSAASGKCHSVIRWAAMLAFTTSACRAAMCCWGTVAGSTSAGAKSR